MQWVFISTGIIAVLLLGYVFYPSIKKTSSKKTKADKKEITEEKKTVQNSEPQIIENKGDLFKEQIFEDPDLKVNYDNLNIGDFFEDENLSFDEDSQPQSDDVYGNKLDGFEEFFTNYRGSNHNNSSFRNRVVRESLSGMLESNESQDIKSQIDGMSDEIKALLISDFLKRKDD